MQDVSFLHEHRDLFKEVDKDNDGYITEEELKTLLRKSKVPVSRQLLRNIMNACDKNKDGRISEAEFQAYALEQDKKLLEVFSQMDPKKTGFFSPHDFLEMVHNLDPNVPSHHVEMLLNQLDTDKDSKISYREFVRYYHLIPITSIVSSFEFFKFESIDLGESTRAASELNKGESAVVTVVAGATAGAISRTSTAPLDRIKTAMQVDKSGISIMGMVRKLLGQDGLKGFFKGNGTNVMKIMPETAIKMLSYDRLKHLVCGNPHKPTTVDRFLLGALAGVVSQTLIYPMDLAKTKLALSKGKEFNGMLDCILRVRREQGLRGLYRGWLAAMLGVMPYSAVDLGVFNTLKDGYVHYVGKVPSAITLLYCGAISGLCGQTLAYPFNLVRTRLQNQTPHKTEYSGVLDCVRKTYQREGVRGLYRGILPTYMRGLPAIAISYAVFEKTKEGLYTVYPK